MALLRCDFRVKLVERPIDAQSRNKCFLQEDNLPDSDEPTARRPALLYVGGLPYRAASALS